MLPHDRVPWTPWNETANLKCPDIRHDLFVCMTCYCLSMQILESSNLSLSKQVQNRHKLKRGKPGLLRLSKINDK